MKKTDTPTKRLQTILLISLLPLLACGVDPKPTVTAQPDAVALVSKAKDTLKVREMLAAFQQQAHRIELNGCEMLYNGKPFALGMTIKELTTIFGAYDLFNRGFYVWQDAGIVFTVESDEENINHKVDYIYIYINELNEFHRGYNEASQHEANKKQDILLLEGVPINKQTRIKDFFANSSFELNQFSIDDSHYETSYFCKNHPAILQYYISSMGNWIYEGTGHLQLKSHPNNNNTSKMGLVLIYYQRN